ncbi:MAG TPA: hypothetical protein VNK03_06695 [Gammaproteobacteria bacterium]|nr:hypothetical protein [Gammaproteobacteria bacterium]
MSFIFLPCCGFSTISAEAFKFKKWPTVSALSIRQFETLLRLKGLLFGVGFGSIIDIVNF